MSASVVAPLSTALPPQSQGGDTTPSRQLGHGSMPARDAVGLMLGVLDDLAAAHDQGLVHGDLKLTSLQVGQDGRVRVMDFGSSTPVLHNAAGSAGHAVPLAPGARRGDPALPSLDVFAAGAVLGELLCGAPLQRQAKRQPAQQALPFEDLELPATVLLDHTLRGIVCRAISSDVQTRYPTARALHAALSAWLTPEPAAVESGHATLDFLLRRMRHKTDFPALSASVVRIQRVATSESESLASLTEEILQDVSLTNKLLRMVNTVHFSAVADGGISTVSRAVALVGFAGIRNMALSVILLEQMGDKGHAAQMKEEYLRALMAGMLAAELSAHSRQSEVAFLAAMMQNLGRLLTEYYFPEEALQIRQQLPASGATHAAREAAARQVLGLGFDDLGVGVAKAWGLPNNMLRALRLPESEVPTRAIDAQADQGVPRMRWLARSANALADALLAADGPAQTSALAVVAERYAPALALRANDLLRCAQDARARMAPLARAMGLQLAPGAAALRLLAAAPTPPTRPAKGSAEGTTEGPDRVPAIAPPIVPTNALANVPTNAPANAPANAGANAGANARTKAPADATANGLSEGPTEGAADSPSAALLASAALPAALQQQRLRLQAGLDAVTLAAQQPLMRLNEVLNLVLETLHQALDLRCVVFCLREPRTGQLIGRVALGPGSVEMRAAFRIATEGAAPTDLFAAVCLKGADLLIADAKSVAARLPAWYRRHVNAATFLLLPLCLKGSPFGLIYADKSIAGALVLSAEDLALLRQLRDQAVRAFGKGGVAG